VLVLIRTGQCLSRGRSQQEPTHADILRHKLKKSDRHACRRPSPFVVVVYMHLFRPVSMASTTQPKRYKKQIPTHLCTFAAIPTAWQHSEKTRRSRSEPACRTHFGVAEAYSMKAPSLLPSQLTKLRPDLLMLRQLFAVTCKVQMPVEMRRTPRVYRKKGSRVSSSGTKPAIRSPTSSLRAGVWPSHRSGITPPKPGSLRGRCGVPMLHARRSPDHGDAEVDVGTCLSLS
jgi:hypothetical protein